MVTGLFNNHVQNIFCKGKIYCELNRNMGLNGSAAFVFHRAYRKHRF